MWHIIIDSTDSSYIVVHTVDGIITKYLEDVYGAVWTKCLSHFATIHKDGYPDLFDEWMHERDYLTEVLSFESEDPIAFTRSLHLIHPELFI